MSNKTKIEEALYNLVLKEDREFVAMLSGEWGIGKTYFWNEFKDKYLKTKDVVYISLFGKNSLQDIEAEIVTKLSKYTKGLKKYTKHLDTVSNLGSKAMGLPINVSMGSILSLFSPNDFKNIIICFDDFERLSEKTSLKDVMGLISQFKEQKECKVIMILNEKELNKLASIDGKKHDEIFSLYKEKIVDYNFHYNPSQEELFSAIEKDIREIKFCNPQAVYGFFKKIDLKNIRIMKQALYYLEKFSFVKDYNYDEKVINEFVEIALNLFVFKAKSNYAYDEFINLNKYATEKSWKNIITTNDEKKILPNIKYEKCLDVYNPNEYKFNYIRSQNKNLIEKNIYHFTDTFNLDRQELQELLLENNNSLSRYTIREKISAQNKRLFTDFSVPNDEISIELFKLLTQHKDDMKNLFTYKDFKSFIEHINQFTKKDTNIIEKEIVEQYIIKHKLDEDSHMGDNPIPQILSDFDWAQKYLDKLYIPQHTITETIVTKTIETIIEKRHISKENSIILSSTSYKDYKSFIKSSTSFVELLVSFLHSYSTYPNIEVAITNIKEALISLKQESSEFDWKVENIVKSGNINLEDEKK